MPATKTGRAFYRVPAGTPSKPCKRCRMAVYWVQVGGDWKLIDCTAPGAVEPSESTDANQMSLLAGAGEVRDGRGVNHFDDCPPVGAE